MASTVQINPCHLMNNIQHCVDVCPAYIQALNSLCGTGTLLARNLLQTFQNIPAYEPVAQQFTCIWDEISKATGTASAAVKTDTLIKLQNVLEVLEASSCDTSTDVDIMDSFQVIGSCLFSFVELQAQFSFSMWKALSKLSKNFSHDNFMNPLNWKSHDRNTLKMSKNSELSSTIKKHFSQLVHKHEVPNSCDHSTEAQSQFFIIPTALKDNNISINQNVSQNVSAKSSTNSVVWSPAPTLWSTAIDSGQNILCSDIASQIKSSNSTVNTSEGNDLDQVINLLSCMPVEPFNSRDNSLSTSQKPYDLQSSRHFWPPGSGPVLSRHMKIQRPWSDDLCDVSFGNDSWIWRTDNINCSSLPDHECNETKNIDNSKLKLSWNLGLNRWNSDTTGENESSSDDVCSSQGQDFSKLNNFLPSSMCFTLRQRRHSSTDCLPDIQDMVPNLEEDLWNSHCQKTSTWPLKQSSSKLEWPDHFLELKCTSLYHPSNL